MCVPAFSTDRAHKLKTEIEHSKILPCDIWAWCEVIDSNFTDGVSELSGYSEVTGDEIGFNGFVQLCTGWCMMSEPCVLKYVFSLFDPTGKGFMEIPELMNLMTDIHKQDLKAGGIDGVGQLKGADSLAALTFDVHGNGKINFEDFTAINTTYPHLLYPVFHIQYLLRLKTATLAFWKCKQLQAHDARVYVANAPNRLRTAEYRAVKRENRAFYYRTARCSMCCVLVGQPLARALTCGQMYDGGPQDRLDISEGGCYWAGNAPL